MKNLLALGLALASVTANAFPFARSSLSYNPGTGAAAGYGNTLSALGRPATVTPGEFGGPVDPFNPPYLPPQLLSIGAGGSVVIGFDSPVRNSPLNPFGLDFIVFGNAGFVITNGNYTGGGITDGSTFGGDFRQTRISVSADNQTFYTLDPSLVPADLLPTFGIGDFSQPVDPALAASDFAGLGLDGIRSRYGSSGGGSGFDIGWARDASGNPVNLEEINYIRFDVLSGHTEIDAISVVPEPSVLQLGMAALGIGSVALWRSRRKAAQS